jgi:acyl-CoA dehydrogenase
MTVQTITVSRATSDQRRRARSAGPFERAASVANIAARRADEVDREARFPREAISEARSQELLGILVPRALGGQGAGVSDVVDICFRLGRACASTAMIYAMHQISLACLVRHRGTNRWRDGFLSRVADEQLLIASSTTEGQGGGAVRSSDAAVSRRGGKVRLERNASVISYGAEADAIITTARRRADAAPSDQVLAVFCKSQFTLEQTQGWDTLGMRGTCSAGFTLRAEGDADQVLGAPYEAIHAQTMTPVAHLLWAAVWAGIAADAVERARKFMRGAARRSGGQLPPGAPHLAEASRSLALMRAMITAHVGRFEAIADEPAMLTSIEYQNAICLLKVEASELAVSTVMSAMRASGLAGYRNDAETSIGRLLRDVLSAPIMINNDRIMATVTASTLVTETPSRVSG